MQMAHYKLIIIIVIVIIIIIIIIIMGRRIKPGGLCLVRVQPESFEEVQSAHGNTPPCGGQEEVYRVARCIYFM